MSISMIILAGILALIVGAGVGVSVVRVRATRRQAEVAREREKILAEAKEKAQRKVAEAAERAKKEHVRKTEEALAEYEGNFERLKGEDKELDGRTSIIDKRANAIRRREELLENRREEYKAWEAEIRGEREHSGELLRQVSDKLSELCGTTREEAKEEVRERLINEAKLDFQRYLRQHEMDLQENAERDAKRIMGSALNRLDYQFQKTSPSNYFEVERKSSQEAVAESEFLPIFAEKMGVPSAWDEENARIGFDINHPYKKELAKQVLKQVYDQNLFQAVCGKPEKLDPICQKVEAKLQRYLGDESRRALKLLKIKDMHREMRQYVGLLKMRFSFLQNILDHSIECAYLAGMIADEIGLDRPLARRAALLHDVGKSIDYEIEGSHPDVGLDLGTRFNEPPDVIAAITDHHDDEPESNYAALAKATDAMSAARPGARKEKTDYFSQRIADLERIGMSYPGVEGVLMLNAGRDMRVMVDFEKVSDDQLQEMADKIAGQIEEEVTYPGFITVTVIRENRLSATAN